MWCIALVGKAWSTTVSYQQSCIQNSHGPKKFHNLWKQLLVNANIRFTAYENWEHFLLMFVMWFESSLSAFVAGSAPRLSSVALLGLKTDRFLQRTVYFLRGDELPNTGRWERELAVAQPALSVRRYLDDITEQTLLREQRPRIYSKLIFVKDLYPWTPTFTCYVSADILLRHTLQR